MSEEPEPFIKLSTLVFLGMGYVALAFVIIIVSAASDDRMRWNNIITAFGMAIYVTISMTAVVTRHLSRSNDMPFRQEMTPQGAVDIEHTFICRCQREVPMAETVEITHAVNHDSTAAGIEKTLIRRCRKCAGESLCSANLTGVHGEVITKADDPDRFREEVFDGLPLPNEHQYGYCRECTMWMRWSVEEQRWVDLDVVGLAEAWEASQASQEGS